MNNMQRINFFTGSSGAGKSTIVKELKSQLNNEQILFLHFDSIGVPSVEEMIRDYGSPSKWQERMTYKWLDIIVNRYQNYNHVIIEGQVNIDFILGAFKKFNVINAKIILIHADDKIRHERLKLSRNQPELINEQMDSWAKFLFDQANKYDIKVIDTSKGSLEDTVLDIKSIINI